MGTEQYGGRMGSRESEAKKEREEQLVEGIGPAMVRLGLVDSLGGWERHDGGKGCLRVDFVYANATPRAVAVEVSAIVNEADMARAKGWDRLVSELRKVARRERLGSWVVATIGDHRAKDMKAEILGLMRCGVSVAIDDPYGRPVFGPGTRDEAAAECERLRDRMVEMGVVCVQRVGGVSAKQHDVNLLWTSEMVRATGIGAALQSRISDNEAKLGEARPRFTHLVVPVDVPWADRNPAATPAPSLPDSIDALWVVHTVDKEDRAHGWWTGKAKAGVWSEISPGDFDRESEGRPS